MSFRLSIKRTMSPPLIYFTEVVNAGSTKNVTAAFDVPEGITEATFIIDVGQRKDVPVTFK